MNFWIGVSIWAFSWTIFSVILEWLDRGEWKIKVWSIPLIWRIKDLWSFWIHIVLRVNYAFFGIQKSSEEVVYTIANFVAMKQKHNLVKDIIFVQSPFVWILHQILSIFTLLVLQNKVIWMNFSKFYVASVCQMVKSIRNQDSPFKLILHFWVDNLLIIGHIHIYALDSMSNEKVNHYFILPQRINFYIKPFELNLEDTSCFQAIENIGKLKS